MRAGDVAGAVPVGGASADMTPAPDHVDSGARSVGDDLSDRRWSHSKPASARNRRLRIDRRCQAADAGPEDERR